jgi:hypothetical protein
MKVGDRVKVFKHAKRIYLGKTGVIIFSGGAVWGGKGKKMWGVRMEDTEETILCLEENLKLAD